MEDNLKMLVQLPPELSPALPPKYYVHGREDGNRMLLSVVLDQEGCVFGFVMKSTVKGSAGKAWMLKKSHLERLLLMQAFGRKWDVSLSPHTNW